MAMPKGRWAAAGLALALAFAVPGGARAAPSSACEAACLNGMADAVLTAMLRHDAGGLPLAEGARYTENGQAIAIGDGLWGTLTGGAFATGKGFQLHASDVDAGEAGYVGLTDEHGTAGLLTLRVKVRDHRIVEIEAVAVRQEYVGPRGGTVSLFQPHALNAFDPAGFAGPPLPAGAVSSREALIGAANAYRAAVQEGRSAEAPFAPDCRRRDNGHSVNGPPTQPPFDPARPAFDPGRLGCASLIDSGAYRYVTGIRGWRNAVVDPAQGLVIAVAALDHAGTVKGFDAPGIGPVAYPSGFTTPGSELTVVMLHVAAGRIVAVDTIQRAGPFGLSGGWDD